MTNVTDKNDTIEAASELKGATEDRTSAEELTTIEPENSLPLEQQGVISNEPKSNGAPEETQSELTEAERTIVELENLGVKFPSIAELGYDLYLKESYGIDEKEIAELAREFQTVNVIGDGVITAIEARLAYNRAGGSSSDDEFTDALNQTDPSGKGLLDFQDFIRLVSLLRKSVITEHEIIEAFKIFDRDGGGTIDAAELTNVMTSMGDAMTEEEADGMIRQADTTGTGEATRSTHAARGTLIGFRRG